MVSERLRQLVTEIADLQKAADFTTQCELAKAATILVVEARRLEAGAARRPLRRMSDLFNEIAAKAVFGTVRR